MRALSRNVSHLAHPFPSVVPRLHRWVAGLSVALVLMLSAAAVAPSLHELVHDGHSEHPSTDRCAIVLFAGGLITAAAFGVSAPKAVWLESRPPRHVPIFLVQSRYLLQPERGPPGV